jgi:hypothetical protein
MGRVVNWLFQAEADPAFARTTRRKDVARQHNDPVICTMPVVHDTINATLRHSVAGTKRPYFKKPPLQNFTEMV